MVPNQLVQPDQINKLMILLLGYLFGLRLIVTCFTGYSAYTKDTKQDWLKFTIFLSWYLFGLYTTLLNVAVIWFYEGVCNKHMLADILTRLDLFLNMATKGLTSMENKEEIPNNNNSVITTLINGLNWVKTSSTVIVHKLDILKNNRIVVTTGECFMTINYALYTLTEPLNNTLYTTPYVGRYYKYLVVYLTTEPPKLKRVIEQLDQVTQVQTQQQVNEHNKQKMNNVSKLFGMLSGVLGEMDKEKKRMDAERASIVKKIDEVTKKKD
jgi:hypothetical protein